MSLTKILKNVSGEELQILNRQVLDGEQYEVPYGQFTKLADSLSIASLVSSGLIVVSNGISDLGITEALAFLKLMEAPSPGFGYYKLTEDKNIPIDRQMLTYQNLEIVNNIDLDIQGELVVIS